MARLDRPVACLIAALVALSLFTFGQLAFGRFDPSAFIVAGDAYSDPRGVPPGIAVLPDSAGYDGQFYYRLSLDPLTSRATDFGITLDNPPYRQQRILYPLVVHLATVADARFVPIAMIATNFAFFGLLAWIAGTLAQTLGRHALWGLLVAAYPGFLITYSRDLVEIVEATFLLGGVLLLRRDKPIGATIAWTLAVWTRETAVIVPVAAAIVSAIDRLRGRPVPRSGMTCFVVPIVGFCALQGALYANWGRFPIRAGRAVLGQGPLEGFTSALASASAISQIAWMHQFVGLAFVVVVGACILYHLAATNAGPTERLACLLYGVLMVSVGAPVWAEDIAFLRAFTQFYLFGAVAVLASRPNPVGAVLALLVGATWAFEFLRLGAAAAIVNLLRAHLGGG